MNKNSQVSGKIFCVKIVQRKFATIYTLFSEQSSGLRKKNFFFFTKFFIKNPSSNLNEEMIKRIKLNNLFNNFIKKENNNNIYCVNGSPLKLAGKVLFFPISQFIIFS